MVVERSLVSWLRLVFRQFDLLFVERRARPLSALFCFAFLQAFKHKREKKQENMDEKTVHSNTVVEGAKE